MSQMDRFLIGALAAGIWTLVVLQVLSNSQTHAQEPSAIEQLEEDKDKQMERGVVNATEIVGLKALVEKIVRDSQIRPQSIPGLDQYVKSVVRGCRVTGGVTGDRISHANISC